MSDLLGLYGTMEPPPVARRLRAGLLEADLVDGQLRTLRHAGREVIRSVAYVVRDRDWGTYHLPLADLAVEETGEGFAVSWQAQLAGPDGAELRLDARITGEAAGRLVFEVCARASAPFETNRCGFCILHPIEGVAGRPVEVTHSDGAVEASVFPDLIEPWQPFQSMAAIRHEAAPGVFVSCRMEGDVFEMEDQRAWSDASYKTYVRPLALPWPYHLTSDELIVQRVVVEIEEAGSLTETTATRGSDTVALSLEEPTGERFPNFGLLVAPEDCLAILTVPHRLIELAPRHLLLHFDPTAGHGAAALEALAKVRTLLPGAEAYLECIVPCEGDLDAELGEAARLVAATGLRLDGITVGPSVDRQSTPPGSAWPPCPPLETIYEAARRAFPGLRLGGGMFSYFTELNRKRPPVNRLDYVTHATCPIVHAADDLSVMQTLEAVPFIWRSARAIIGEGTAYHLGPTTIGMRQNPYGSRTLPNPENRRVAMAADDPRGRGLFAAAWLVGYAARLAGSGLERWTGGAVAGPRGIIDDAGQPLPAFMVAAELAALSRLKRLGLVSTDRAAIDGICAMDENGPTRLWIANLSPEPRRVRLPPSPAEWHRSSGIGEVSSPTETIELGPYAVAGFDAGAPSSAV